MKSILTHYNKISIVLHWLMFLLIAAAYACMEFRGLFPKGSDERELIKMLHFSLGLSVLALVIVRIIARVRYAAPAIVPAINPLQEKAAKGVHLALYVFMIGMPIAGWLILSGYGKPIPFFGLELPSLMGVNKHLAGQIKEVHETVGELGYYLIALHAAAALFHHYVQKDNTLTRMLPWKK